MSKLKTAIIYFILGYFIFWALVVYKYTEPDFSNNECETIRENYEQIKPGMSKEEVLLLIDSEPRNKIYPYSGVFPEQKTQWEIWLLCAELGSCIVADSGIEKCYKWQMVAFDSKTEKVIKAFHDSPDRVGF